MSEKSIGDILLTVLALAGIFASCVVLRGWPWQKRQDKEDES